MSILIALCALSSRSINRPAHRCLLLLLMCTTQASMVGAQTQWEIKRAEGVRLLNEGAKLVNERTKESLDAALLKATEVLSLFKSIQDPSGQGAALNLLATTHRFLGDHQKAFDYYRQAQPLAQAGEDSKLEAIIFSNIGSLFFNELDDMQSALGYYKQALPLFVAAKATDDELITLNVISLILGQVSDRRQWFDYFTGILPLFRSAKDDVGEAATLNLLGNYYFTSNDYQKSLDHHLQALRLSQRAKDRKGEANTLNNIGLALASLGEYQQALDFFNQNLSMSIDDNNFDGQSASTLNIGRLYMTSGDFQKALDNFLLALSICRRIGNYEGGILGNIGTAYAALGDHKKAIDYFNQSLSLYNGVKGARPDPGLLSNLGWSYKALGNSQKALEYFNQALQLNRDIGDRKGEAVVLSSLAYFERDRGNLHEALERIESALVIVESLRDKITYQGFQASSFAADQSYYETCIDTLMRLHKQQPSAGYDSKALQVNERRRARTLLDMLAEAGGGIRQDIDPKLTRRERSVQQRLNTLAQQQIRLLSISHTGDQAKAIAVEIGSLTTELEQVRDEIRRSNPRYASLTQPRLLVPHEIQQHVLDADTLLLEYAFGDERSYLWAVTTTAITSYELPKRKEIEAAAREVYDLLNARNTRIDGETPNQKLKRITQSDAQYPIAAARLSQVVLAPVAQLLGTKRLLIISDGALQYVPFAALPDPVRTRNSTPLIINHEIISLPSASTLGMLRQEMGRRQPAPKTLAVIADPVFARNDERLKARINVKPTGTTATNACNDSERGLIVKTAAKQSGVADSNLCIPRLPGTRLEAEAIVKFVPQGQFKKSLDFAASRETVTHPDLGQYRYVHFATHGLLDSKHPELSGIVLSLFDEQGGPLDGFLHAHEIFNLKLAADVVVLSACQTGLGREISGEGLVGLTRGFMYAGVPRVVVSLWSVDDDATAELMSGLYREMLIGKLRPAKALQAAQMSLLRKKRFSAPYYWAAFTLQGEWR